MSDGSTTPRGRSRPGRAPTSREVTLAWSLSLDAEGCERGRSRPVFETPVIDPADETETSYVMHRLAPSELLDRVDDAIALDEFEGGSWDYLCLMHDDDWANADGDALAQGLAKLSRHTRGVVLAAHMDVVTHAWLLSQGVAREVAPLPPIVFAPSMTPTGAREAIAAAASVLAALPRQKRPRLDRVLPDLVEKTLGAFELQRTADPLRYTFGGHPGFELRFVSRRRACVPILCRAGGDAEEGYALREVELDSLDEGLADLAGQRWSDSLGVQLPLFLATHGEAVMVSALLASLHQVRWQVQRLADAPRARPEVIQACVDFLLDGVWDEVARENLIRLVQHANAPLSVAKRLESHTSRSLQQACAARLKRG